MMKGDRKVQVRWLDRDGRRRSTIRWFRDLSAFRANVARADGANVAWKDLASDVWREVKP